VHIVDDDASFARAIERRLKYAGYEVATYASAQHLLDRLPNPGELGCILLDVQIPGMHGPALQAKLSELGWTLPIIFVTGHPDIPSTVRAIKAGADDFLTKPRDSADLVRAIELALARQKAALYLKNKLDVLRARIGTLTPRQREVFALVDSWQDQQRDRPRARRHRTDDQGAPPHSDGENAGSVRSGTCFPRGARRLDCAGQRAA